MAEEKKEGEIRSVSYRDLSDADFIRNLDYLSAHYYNDYFANLSQAKGRADLHVYDASAAQCLVPYVPQPQPQKICPRLTSGYDKRRSGFLIGILIASFLSVLAALTGFFRDFMPDWVALFGGEQSIFYFDLPIALTETAFSLGSSPYTQYLTESSGWVRAVLYAGIAADAAYFLLSLLATVLSVAALCGKAKNGWYKRYRFGWIGIAELVCVVLMAAACCFSGYVNIAGRTFTVEWVLYPGYMTAAFAEFSVLTAVFSGFAYRAVTKIQ